MLKYIYMQWLLMMPLEKWIKHLHNYFAPATTISWKRISQIFWIYFMPSCGWTKQWAFDENLWHPPKWLCSISRSQCKIIYDSYFHGHSRGIGSGCARDHGCGHDHKGNFKETFYHQKWNNNEKMGKENVKIVANKMKL